MENTKNTILATVIITLILGLTVGYFVGVTRLPSQNTPSPAVTGVHGSMNGTTSTIEGKMGDELDKAFLQEMIIHHKGALEMANILLKGTQRPELIKLANDIIVAQTQEIQMMSEWQKTWFGQ